MQASGRSHSSARGFTYLLLLFGIALAGIGAAAFGQQWQAAAQREREAELLFRGAAIQAALQAYHARVVRGEQQYPTRLEQLIEDDREGAPQFPLRRLYADPFTGRVDWRLLRDAQGGIVGVHSRVRLAAMRQFTPPGVTLSPAPAVPSSDESVLPRRIRVGDWRFIAPGVAEGSIRPDPAEAPGPVTANPP